MKNKVLKHLKTVCKHKYYVGKYCFMAGLPLRGILHDLSKFSPFEFIESVKYYQGTRSPIDACKEVNGYSKAWMHHKGRNSHHYEYWQDNFDNGGSPLQMPFKDACEMLCDYLGAGQAYTGDDFSFAGELQWWINKTNKPIAMHPQTQMFITYTLHNLALCNNKKEIKQLLNKNKLQLLYNISQCVYNIERQKKE